MGSLRWADDELGEALRLTEFPAFVQQTADRKGWKKFPPGEAWEVLPFEAEGGPRSDRSTVLTCAPGLLRRYLVERDGSEDPLQDTGADALIVSFPLSLFSEGSQPARHRQIEQTLNAALRTAQSGRCLGGGLGLERSHADLLIFDGRRSLEIIRRTLKSLHLFDGPSIEYLGREKKDHRIML